MVGHVRNSQGWLIEHFSLAPNGSDVNCETFVELLWICCIEACWVVPHMRVCVYVQLSTPYGPPDSRGGFGGGIGRLGSVARLARLCLVALLVIMPPFGKTSFPFRAESDLHLWLMA